MVSGVQPGNLITTAAWDPLQGGFLNWLRHFFEIMQTRSSLLNGPV